MYLKTMQAYEGFAMYLMYLRRIGDAPRVWCAETGHLCGGGITPEPLG